MKTPIELKKCKPIRDLTNQRFGRLVAISFEKRKNKHTYWNCICDCGNKILASSHHLISGNTKSCSCLRTDTFTTNGVFKNKVNIDTYTSYVAMKRRCNDDKNNHYKYYGGRGIKVCQRWLDSFDSFLQDMGQRPSKSYSIDRINNDGNYEPENCRWATAKEQANNRRITLTT